jgi:hypothetical protein
MKGNIIPRRQKSLSASPCRIAAEKTFLVR